MFYRILLTGLFLGMLAYRSAAQQPVPDPQWIGWGDVPWVLIDSGIIENLDLHASDVSSILKTVSVHAQNKAASSVQTALPAIRLVSVIEQAKAEKSLANDWKRFYALVGIDHTGNENHFDQWREQLIARVSKEGFTAALFLEAARYHAEIIVANNPTLSPNP